MEGLLVVFGLLVLLSVPIGIIVVIILLLSNLSKQRTRLDAAELEMSFVKGRLMALEKLVKKMQSGEIIAKTAEPQPVRAAPLAENPAVPAGAVIAETPPHAGEGSLAEPPRAQVVPPVRGQEIPSTSPAIPPVHVDAPHPAEKESGTLEELLSAKLFVWLGAIALLLATIFLIKYSFDKGWVTPPLRVAMGYFFGIVFLGVGEYLSKRSNYVSQGFSSAGIGVIYASTLAAVNLYHLVSPFIGFGLMSLATIAAIFLSIQRGPIVAVIGLLGGFMTPYWLKTGTPRPQALFGYLFLLELALFYTAKRKKWLPYALMAMTGGFLWVIAWFSFVYSAQDSLWIGLFLLASTALFLFFAISADGGDDEKAGRATTASHIFFGSIAVVLVAVLCGKGSYGTQEWVFFGILSLGTIILAHFKKELFALPFISLAVSAILFGAWPLDGVACFRYLVTISLFGALFALSGYALSHFSAKRESWAFMSALSSVILFLIAYFKVKPHLSSVPWGTAGFVLALVFSFLAYLLLKKGEDFLKETGWIAAAGCIHLSLAVSFSFDKAWWSAGWGLCVPLILYAAYKYDLKILRILSIILTAATVARLVLNPNVLKYPAGDAPFLNWMLYGYGLPLLAFACAVYFSRAAEDDEGSSIFQSAATVIALVFGSLEIHHFVNGKLNVPVSALKEWGMIFVFTLCVVHIIFFIGEKFRLKAFSFLSQALSVALPVICSVALFASHNPLFSNQDVGSVRILNKLLFIYLLPSLLLFAIGGRFKAAGKRREISIFASIFSFLLFFGFIVFEVRQAFQGPFLNGHGMTNPEKYTYSIVFVLLGFAFAVIGMVTGKQFARIVSLALMLIAIFKVFLYDVSALKGILRPLSFFGLGFSLLLLAYLYRRFVFGLDRKKEEEQ